MELLAHEKDALGLYLSGHPLDRYAEALRAFGARTVGDLVLAELPPSADGAPGPPRSSTTCTSAGSSPASGRSRPRRAIGWASSCSKMRRARSKSSPFPRPSPGSRTLIENGTLVAVRGKFERDDESARMQANELFPLDSLRERLSKAVRIRMNGDCTRQKLEALWDLLAANQGDRPVAIELEVDARRHRSCASAPT